MFTKKKFIRYPRKFMSIHYQMNVHFNILANKLIYTIEFVNLSFFDAIKNIMKIIIVQVLLLK